MTILIPPSLLFGGKVISLKSLSNLSDFPPSGSYYLTVLLLEYHYSYEIVDTFLWMGIPDFN